MNNKILICFAVVLFLSGCIAPAKVALDYTPPVQKEIKNEIGVTAGFEATWSKLIRGMSKSFYVINNIDKESRLINISFSTSKNISDYVDCGTSDRRFSLGRISKNTTYQVAGKSEYLYPSTAGGHYYFKVFRHPSLEGRSNIYVAPDGNGTRISVNTRYIWAVSSWNEGYFYDALEGSTRKLVISKRKGGTSSPISFNTNSVGGDGSDTSCVSTGKFESEILDIVR